MDRCLAGWAPGALAAIALLAGHVSLTGCDGSTVSEATGAAGAAGSAAGASGMGGDSGAGGVAATGGSAGGSAAGGMGGGDCPGQCSGHGQCVAGSCQCDAEYQGSECGQCAANHVRDSATDSCTPSLCVPEACSGTGDTCDPATGFCCTAPCSADHRECVEGGERVCDQVVDGCSSYGAPLPCPGASCRCTGEDLTLTLMQWGAGENVRAYAVKLGPQGSIRVAGTSDGPYGAQPHSGNNDAFLQTLVPGMPDNDRYRQWGIQPNELVGALAVWSDGASVVAGTMRGAFADQTPQGGADMAIVRRNADGSPGWARLIGSGDDDEATGVVINTSGDVYVGGLTDGDLAGMNQGVSDIVLSKLDGTDGTVSWTKTWGTGGEDQALDLAQDAAGNLLLAGRSQGEVACWKRDADGDQVWTATYGAPSGGKAFGVAALDDGGAVVVGSTSGDLGGTGSGGAFVTRLSSTGSVSWTDQLGGNSNAAAHAVTVADDGDIYLTGRVDVALVPNGHQGNADAFVQRRRASGEVVWTRQLGTDEFDVAWDLVVGADGTVYVTGITLGVFPGMSSSTDSDAFLAIIKQ